MKIHCEIVKIEIREIVALIGMGMTKSFCCGFFKKLQGNYGSVSAYVVSSCPQNESAWTAAAKRLNCNLIKEPPFHHYYCLPNEDFTELAEFCFDKNSRGLPSGVCLKLGIGGFIRNVVCSNFTSGCPDTHFLSEDIYQYPACFQVNTEKGCYLAEGACPPISRRSSAEVAFTPEKGVGVILGPVIGSMLLLTLLIAFFVFCLCRRRGLKEKSTNESESQPMQPLLGHIDKKSRRKRLMCCVVYVKGDEMFHKASAKRNQQMKIIQQWQKDDNDFFTTRACRQAEITLKSCNYLNIIGHSGSGKTAIAQHIALIYCAEGYNVIYTNSFQEIKEQINVIPNQFFLLNDPVGQDVLDEKLQSYIKSLEEFILTQLNNSKIKLVFTSRKVVVNDKRLRCRLLTSSTVDIDGEMLRLSEDEKKAILGKHIDLSKIGRLELSEILKIDSYFPLLCFLYGENKKYRDQGYGFFKGFCDIILQEIQYFQTKNSEKGKFCVLVLLSIFEHGLEENLLTDIEKECSKIVQDVYELCGLKRDKPRSFLLKELSTLEGSYVKKTGAVYTFLHDYMMEATNCILGNTYPIYMIRHCPSSFLRRGLVFKTTEPSKISEMDDNISDLIVKLDEIHAPVLVERFISEIVNGNCIDVFLSPCFRHQLVITEFISQLDDSLRQELLRLRTYDNEDRSLNIKEGMTFTKLDFLLTDKEEFSPLHLLIIYNYHTIVRAICDKTDMSKIRNYELFSASCASGNIDLIQYIMEKSGSHVHEKRNEKMDPLQIAAKFNYGNIIKFLLQRYISNVNCFSCGWTPLTLASLHRFDSNEHNQDHAVQTLIDYNADINMCNTDGASPLFCAAERGHESVVQILIDNKADVNKCDNNGVSPLHISAENRHVSVVKKLLDNEAKVNIRNNSGATALHIAAKNGHHAVVKILLDKSADLNICKKNGVSPLYEAADNGHCSVINMLLDHKVDVNLCKNNGVSPLYVAAKNGYDSVVAILLNNGADVNVYNKNNKGPLYIAAHFGHDSVVKMLLDAKANANIRNKNGATPLHIAIYNRHDSTVKILLDKNADVNICDNIGIGPLFIAAHTGLDDVVKLLLKNKGNVNMCDHNGVSPLCMAAKEGHYSIVKILLDNNADVYKCDKNDFSALHMAAQNGHHSVCQILLDNKADVNMCDKNGISPLYLAALSGHYSVVKTLFENKADINKCDKNGFSALNAAAHKGHDSIVKLLTN